MSSILSERKTERREGGSPHQTAAPAPAPTASAPAAAARAASEAITSASVASPAIAPEQLAPSLVQVASVWGTLLVFWLLLSGMFAPFLIAAGIGCALGVTLIARRMRLIDSEGHPIHLCLRAFVWYWPWLLKEIARSAWQVARIVLHPRLPISPTIVRFKPSQQSALGLVIHANSITLTPGTMCIEAPREEFLIHALTAEGAAGTCAGSEMDRRVAKLETGR
jgi:multicomponent Na+:H+ antiporter subunit E